MSALHVDGGGVSDIVFAVMHLLGLNFEPRIPRLSDRRLYAFETPSRYGQLAPLFGQRLDADLIRCHWDEIGRIMAALRDRVVTPSLILKKLSAYRQQNSLARAVAFHRLGRFRDPGHENQQVRAAALTLVTATIILFNCRYLAHALAAMRHRGMVIDEALIPQLSPLVWNHINLAGDYVWSDVLLLESDGFMPLKLPAI
ncbi:MAG: hypothetical protein RLY86_3496 [Pseudomonadota bacterium]